MFLITLIIILTFVNHVKKYVKIENFTELMNNIKKRIMIIIIFKYIFIHKIVVTT